MIDLSGCQSFLQGSNLPCQIVDGCFESEDISRIGNGGDCACRL